MCAPRWTAAVAILVITVLAVTACSGGGGTSAGHGKTGGTATVAWVGASSPRLYGERSQSFSLTTLPIERDLPPPPLARRPPCAPAAGTVA